MKVPVLWLAAAFATGAITGVTRPLAPSVWLVPCAVFLAASLLVLRFRKAIWTAWVLALGAWIALGGAAAAVERIAVPQNQVGRLVKSGRIDLNVPMRWTGRLREDPLLLPWGARYELNLESVEAGGQNVAISGGLRVNYYKVPHHPENLAAVRAGDRVEMLARARVPRDYLDPGAFDFREHLAREGIDLTGTLRSAELLQKIDTPPLTIANRLARVRGELLGRIERQFAHAPENAAVLRAMLLGDRIFVDSDLSGDFQKIGAYHVLVVAGLHVGALCAFLYWVGRRLRAPMWLTAIVTVAGLIAYLGVVQDRAPILRATLMAVFYLAGRPFFRFVELMNSVALAGLALIFWRPSALLDASFELSFLAAGVIAGLAIPWIDRTGAPYIAGLRHLGDATHDLSFPPRVVQFRMELRAMSGWLANRLPARWCGVSDQLLIAPCKLGLRLWELFLLSFALQCGMLPVMALEFHRVSLAGPLSNVPTVLLTGLIVPIGFVALGATFVWARLANGLCACVGWLVQMLIATVRWFAHWPRMSYRIPSPPLWLIAVWSATLIALCALARERRDEPRWQAVRSPLRRPAAGATYNLSRWKAFDLSGERLGRVAEVLVATVCGILTIVAATHPFRPRLAPGKMEVTVLDVGQGDSIFAAFPDGETMLVDGGGEAGSESISGYRSGPDIGEEVVAPYLWSRGIKRLDVVALTHAHHDHMDGLRAVLSDFRVRELWVGPDVDNRAYDELISQAGAAGVRVFHRHDDERFQFGDADGAILWPKVTNESGAPANNDSLVLKLRDGGVRFLLTGDVEQKTEKTLVADGAPLAADFLKVPHHGSKTSSTAGFLAAVAPRVAVISVGEGNSFGQPFPAVVERYMAAGIRLLRTDLDGAVTASTDGRTLTVKAFRERGGGGEKFAAK